MGEILINTDSLAAEIGMLYTLGAKIAASSIACPAVVGGGSSVQEIENLGKNFQSIHNSVSVLVANTVSFMENVKASYQKNDSNAAKNYT